LNLIFLAAIASCKSNIARGPIPCRELISVSVKKDSCSSDEQLIEERARLAGAASDEQLIEERARLAGAANDDGRSDS